jgi:hypothetical protein
MDVYLVEPNIKVLPSAERLTFSLYTNGRLYTYVCGYVILIIIKVVVFFDDENAGNNILLTLLQLILGEEERRAAY